MGYEISIPLCCFGLRNFNALGYEISMPLYFLGYEISMPCIFVGYEISKLYTLYQYVRLWNFNAFILLWVMKFQCLCIFVGYEISKPYNVCP